jgi:short-subunit dehydrogenase
VPHFIKQKGGQIVGVTSLSSKVAMGYRASYNASKSAFLGLLDTIRSELSPYGIKVCNIMPGYIKSNLSRNAFVGTAGEKYGKTTRNNDGGMEAD